MTFTSKRLAIALAVSVALNLFLTGFIAVRALHGARHHERGHRHGQSFGQRDREPGARQALRRVLRQREPAFRAQAERLRATRRAVSAAFTAEPFEAAALERTLAELRAQTEQSQRLMHEALIETAPSLTPEQRGRLARRAFDRGPRARHRPRD
jgi:Spy/CpxP family protein refolding chaperone